MANKVEIPADSTAAGNRNARLEKIIQGAQERRRAGLAKVKPIQPSTNPIPGLKNRA